MKLSAGNAIELPFNLETQLERDIAADPAWLAGLEWGQPRLGHPEGKVVFHIQDVLGNIDKFWGNSSQRANLRLIALLYDTFKYKLAQAESGATRKSHGYWAKQFAARYINDEGVLAVIELHDEAYKASLWLTRYGNREAAERCARELMKQLDLNFDLFMRFYLCDSYTGDKSKAHYEWFKGLVEKKDILGYR